MKKTKTQSNNSAHKKEEISLLHSFKALLALCILLSFFLIGENVSFLVSLVKPLGVEKVLAIETVKDAQTLLSVTPSPTDPLLYSASSLVATPTPTPTPVHHPSPQGDFCLNIPMLMYHHVQPMDIAKSQGHGQLTVDSEVFDQQMQYLLSLGYTMISSEEVVNAVRTRQQLPEKSITITIDDGYDDAYDYAYPIAKKYNIKMDFMIPTGLIGNAGYMNWEQLREMSNNPLIKIFNHTWSHAALGGADQATIEYEITSAQNELEKQLGVKNPIFVYPYGSFGPLAIDVLKKHGFIAALTTIQGTRQCQSTIMEMQRTRIGNTTLSFYGF